MNPLIKKRIAKFKATKRGFWSFCIFATLLLLSLFAELLANDKPILVVYDGSVYMPVFKTYPETEFGGVFETEADYKDPFVTKKIDEKGFMLMPPIKYGHQFSLGTHVLAEPSSEHLLGTDDQGRDIAARVIYGFRLSVLFGLALAVLSSVIGIFIGTLSGYFGGIFDIFMQRLLEIWDSLPLLLILIIISSIIEPNLVSIFCIMLAFSWMGLVNLVRAEVLKARKLEYVTAAKALGVKQHKIMFRHILPNTLVSTFAMLPFIVTGAITILAQLDFLGFGLPGSYPSLGELTLQGKNNLDAPWIGITAFCIITIMLSLFIFIGEAVRDAFDPRKVLK